MEHKPLGGKGSKLCSSGTSNAVKPHGEAEMISESKTQPTYSFESVMLELRRAPEEFVLTGSRYFGRGSDYDWDFFACDRHETRSFLEDLGFKKKPGYLGKMGLPGDKFTSCVYERVAKSHSERIHVQLIKKDKFDVKRRAQEMIKSSGLAYHISKSMSESRHAIWDLVHDLLTEADSSTMRLRSLDTFRSVLKATDKDLTKTKEDVKKLRRRGLQLKLTTLVTHVCALAYVYMPKEMVEYVTSACHAVSGWFFSL